MAVAIIAIIGFFITVITIIVFYYKDKRYSAHMPNEDSLDEISLEEAARKKKLKQFNSLKHGLFLVLGSLGFILGIFIESIFGFDDSIIAIPLACVGAGMGLILFYFMTLGMLKEDDKNDLV